MLALAILGLAILNLPISDRWICRWDKVRVRFLFGLVTLSDLEA